MGLCGCLWVCVLVGEFAWKFVGECGCLLVCVDVYLMRVGVCLCKWVLGRVWLCGLVVCGLMCVCWFVFVYVSLCV